MKKLFKKLLLAVGLLTIGATSALAQEPVYKEWEGAGNQTFEFSNIGGSGSIPNLVNSLTASEPAGWASYSKSVGTKNASVLKWDPATDEQATESVNLYGAKISTTYYFTFNVKGVETFKAYIGCGNTDRGYDVVATPNDGTEAVSAYNANMGKNVAEIVELTLDPTKSYSIKVAGSGGDIFCYAVKFVTVAKSPVISSFEIGGVSATIDQTAKTIVAEVPYSTEGWPTLAPVVSLGGTATSYTPTEAQDFSAPVVYTVTDGVTPTEYIVTITRAEANGDATLKDLKVGETTIEGFDPEVLDYNVVLPFAATLESAKVSATTNYIAAKATITDIDALPDADETATKVATVVVAPEDEMAESKTYTITFTRLAASSEKQLLTLSVGGFSAVINEEAKTITLDVADPTSIDWTAAKTTQSPLAIVSIDGETKVVTVTAEDGTTQEYTIAVSALKDLYQVIFSNGFDAFIVGDTVKVYYMQGTEVPTVKSVKYAEGVAEGTTYNVAEGKIVVTGTDASTKEYTIKATEVAPYTTLGTDVVFNGEETYVASGYGWDDTKKWKFSKDVEETTNKRISEGKNRLYFFVGPATQITFTESNTSTRAVKIFVNGNEFTDVTELKKGGTVTITGLKWNENNMIAIVSNKTSGDGGVGAMKLEKIIETKILSMTLSGQEATIDEEAKSIIVELPYGTDATALTPEFSISEGATISPEGAQDFSSPVTYTVTGVDGTTTATYTVSVTIASGVNDAVSQTKEVVKTVLFDVNGRVVNAVVSGQPFMKVVYYNDGSVETEKAFQY
jgi:hypothetical protein